MKLNVDTLNTFLILLSLVVAYILPFELFLISYAILGPLHYITEINWIKNKSYFVNEKYWLTLCLILTFIVVVPALFGLNFIEDNLPESWVTSIDYVRPYTNMAIFLCLVGAFIALLIKNKRIQLVLFLVFGILSYFLIDISVFNLIVGILLPTLIHVYIFTLLFMWYGVLKKESGIGGFNVVLLLLVPLIIYFLPSQENWKIISDYVKNTYVESRFYLLNVYVSKTIGLSDGSNFNFTDVITSKIQLFISFAYTYHYLNWFSKTTVIGWHKTINKQKLVILLFIWITSVVLYAYDFKLGLILLLFLSFMHVFLEFPINVISIKEIVKHYSKKLTG